MIRSALRAGDAPLAVQTGLVTAEDPLPLEGFGFSDGWPQGTLSFSVGCRGDVASAALVNEAGWSPTALLQEARRDAGAAGGDLSEAGLQRGLGEQHGARRTEAARW